MEDYQNTPDSTWAKLADQLAAKVEDYTVKRLSRIFERFVRDSIKLVFTEKEAAQLLDVSVYTIQNWRKNKIINHYEYAGRARYGLHHLQDFITRNEHKHLPSIYQIQHNVSMFGVETEAVKNAKK